VLKKFIEDKNYLKFISNNHKPVEGLFSNIRWGWMDKAKGKMQSIKARVP